MKTTATSQMKKLGARNYSLIRSGVQRCGTFNPDEILYAFEEALYVHEVDEIIAFLKWCHEGKRQFGSGNYEQVFSEFKASK